MSRSEKKGPFTDEKLMEKVTKALSGTISKVIKTWSRRSAITPEMVGLTMQVHNGHKFIDVFITEPMVGHKLGEFSPTRTFRVHSSKKGLAEPVKK
ncbi:30S ribosomal protein S19 [candidate division WWE3 bacterium]|nr:30S ribosomal protein S19 [candidate division WWE3 bacterium]